MSTEETVSVIPNHSPGGSPAWRQEGTHRINYKHPVTGEWTDYLLVVRSYVATAPAPRREVDVPSSAELALPDPALRRRGRCTWQEVQHHARGAVRLTMGDAYSDADRDEVWAYVLDHVAAQVPGGYGASEIPTDWVNMTRLSNHARNGRAMIDRRRAQADLSGDLAAEMENGAAHWDPEPVLSPDLPEAGDLDPSAQAAAMAALDSMGAARLGKGWVAAYSAARTAQGADTATVAAELGYGTVDDHGDARYRKAASRSTAALRTAPHFTAGDYRQATGAADLYGNGSDRTRAKQAGDPLGGKWRGEGAPMDTPHGTYKSLSDDLTKRTVKATRTPWNHERVNLTPGAYLAVTTGRARWTRYSKLSHLRRMHNAARHSRNSAARRRAILEAQGVTTGPVGAAA